MKRCIEYFCKNKKPPSDKLADIWNSLENIKLFSLFRENHKYLENIPVNAPADDVEVAVSASSAAAIHLGRSSNPFA